MPKTATAKKPKGEHPKRKKARLTQELRREIVLKFRLQGMTDRQIATAIKLQYGSDVTHVTVNSDWKAALATRRDENDADFIDHLDLMNARYEAQIKHWWARGVAGDHRAAEIILRTMKAIREMNGLDAELGSFVIPYLVEEDDGTYDYSRLTTEEQEYMATLAEKAKVPDELAERRKRSA